MYKLKNSLPFVDSKSKLALCCGIEGDHHALPSDFARLVFESYGWSVLNFGPNTPLFCMESEMKRNKPEVICLSATILDELDRLTHDFLQLSDIARSIGCKIIIGGRAFSEESIRERFPADFFPANYTELASIIKAH
jgi:methanogenic corrinoid protein MtbC1